MKKLLTSILVAFGLIIIVFFWLFFQIYKTGQQDFAESADAIVVFGAAQYAGKPSPVFEARLNHAFELFEKDFADFIITTGGIHPGENFSEGKVGKTYLTNKGIPEQNIIFEKNSITTAQNITAVAQIAKDRNFKKLILVSDPFHMYRAKLIARNFGLDVLTSPTRKSPISKNRLLELKYMTRETFLAIVYIIFKM